MFFYARKPYMNRRLVYVHAAQSTHVETRLLHINLSQIYTFIHLAIVKITVKTQDAIGAGLTTSADVLNVKVFKIENEAFRHVT